MRQRRPEQLDEAGRPKVDEADWDTAFGRVRDRTSDSAGKLDSALDRERTRENDLDDLFRQAREQAQEDD